MKTLEVLPDFDDSIAPIEKIIEAITNGLPFDSLDKVAHAYGISPKEMADLIHIPPRTLQHLRTTGQFDDRESERLYRFTLLFRRTFEVFDDDMDSARKFLAASQPGLDGKIPLEMARSEMGMETVMDLLGRIEFGVYT